MSGGYPDAVVKELEKMRKVVTKIYEKNNHDEKRVMFFVESPAERRRQELEKMRKVVMEIYEKSSQDEKRAMFSVGSPAERRRQSGVKR